MSEAPRSGIVNWHWREKNLLAWSKIWFAEQLEGLQAGDVKLTQVTDVEGDCELGMRKSKLITIYDLRISCKWEGPAVEGDGEQIHGTLSALEVSHDMDEDEYQFETTVNQAGSEANKLKEQARKQLADKLRSVFQQLPKDMIASHGKDLLVDNSPAVSGTTTPVTSSSTAQTSKASTQSQSQSGVTTSSKAGNTTTVKVDATYAISANDLFELMTDESKVPMWTRNPAKIRAEEGADVSLFGGNISGKVVAVKKPTQFKTTWRAPTWPEGHYGTLDMTLEQGSSDTKLILRLDGVPLGKEDETEKNLDIYYIRSLKQIGYALYNPLSPSSSGPALRPPSTQTWWSLQAFRAANLIAPLLSFGIIITVLLAIYHGPTFNP